MNGGDQKQRLAIIPGTPVCYETPGPASQHAAKLLLVVPSHED